MNGRESLRMRLLSCAVAALVVLGLSGLALAANPVVKTVPWVANNSLIPHDTYLNKQITLKGTSDVQGASIQYTWDFGDGSPVVTGAVTNQFVIEAKHAYSAPVGTTFSASLTVLNTSTGESATKPYFVKMQDKTLPVEVNIAIDEGLWYLHKTENRYASGGVDYGHWASCPAGTCYATLSYYGISALNTNAFEATGHLESGPADDPYTETVARAHEMDTSRL